MSSPSSLSNILEILSPFKENLKRLGKYDEHTEPDVFKISSSVSSNNISELISLWKFIDGLKVIFDKEKDQEARDFIEELLLKEINNENSLKNDESLDNNEENVLKNEEILKILTQKFLFFYYFLDLLERESIEEFNQELFLPIPQHLFTLLAAVRYFYVLIMYK